MRLPARGRAGADHDRGVGGGRRAHGVDGGRAAHPRLRPRGSAAAARAHARRSGRRRRATTSASGSSSRSARRPPTAWSASRRRSPRPGSTRFPEAADATPLLARARSIKTEQEVERLRLANEIAAAAMEHVRELLRPGMREAEVAALWQGFVHGEGTGYQGQVELALPFSLVWAGRGIKTFTATGDLPVVEGEPVLFEIWVCADGYWADHTKNLVVGELKPEYAELEAQLMDVYEGALDSHPARRADGGARPAGARAAARGRLSRPADAPDLPRRRRARARAAVSAPGRRRRVRRGDGARGRAGRLLAGRRRAARRGQLPRHRATASRSSPRSPTEWCACPT